MARPSKTQQFAIYKDTASTTHIPQTAPYEPSFDDTLPADNDDLNDSNLLPTDTEIEIDNEDGDRRGSTVSSLPESSTETDVDYSLPMHKSFTPPMIRPSFRKPDSVHNIYNRSASKRHGFLPRSRTRTPKGSPLAKKKHEEVVEEREYPLVLLHVTLLPVDFRWSAESMQEVLPPHTLENLQLLRSKVSETILQRGILVPHPRDEYDMLEERLLEALELKKERVTRCGHFRARGSTSSEEGSVDSGVGSSVHDSDNEVCMTCRSPVKTAGSGIGVGKNKWSIKVFAANGLMRSSAWTAAWSEMERVDVEILPWINEELRKKLDAKLAEEESELRRKEEEDRIRSVVEEQVQIAYEGRENFEVEARRSVLVEDPFLDAYPNASLSNELILDRYTIPKEKLPEHTQDTSDLPPVYARKDIPLSLLLRNYLFLLAQDKKNIAIFGLAMLALWMSLRSALLPAVDISALPEVQGAPNTSVLMASQDVRAEVLEGVDANVEVATDYDKTDIPNVGEGMRSFREGPSENNSAAAGVPSSEVLHTEPSEVSGIEDAADGICENPDSQYVLFW